MRLFLFCLLATAAAAQPSGDAVLEAWAEGWASAARGVTVVEFDESMERTFEGPRGETVVAIDARIGYTRDLRPDRSVRRVRVNGTEVDAAREPRHRRRLERAFGDAGREVSSPPALPVVALRRARALGLEDDRVDGVAAWRVRLDAPEASGVDRAEAWFSRSRSPQLLRLRLEGRRPRGGRIVRDVRYVRVEGLDLPAETRTTFTTRQRRRLRDYVVSLTATSRFRDHVVR